LGTAAKFYPIPFGAVGASGKPVQIFVTIFRISGIDHRFKYIYHAAICSVESLLTWKRLRVAGPMLYINWERCSVFQEAPCIDLIGFLKRGQETGCLIVVIPWIVEFCSVLDPVTSKLPYYQQLYARLLGIYQVAAVRFPEAGS
jgi:hypothetical protein